MVKYLVKELAQEQASSLLVAMTLSHKRNSLGSRLQAISERRLPSRSVRPVLHARIIFA